jgi:hypothetical protein
MHGDNGIVKTTDMKEAATAMRDIAWGDCANIQRVVNALVVAETVSRALGRSAMGDGFRRQQPGRHRRGGHPNGSRTSQYPLPAPHPAARPRFRRLSMPYSILPRQAA